MPVFEDLIYQNLRQAGAASSGQTELPTGLQVGLGHARRRQLAQLQPGQPAAKQQPARPGDSRQRLLPDSADRRHRRLHRDGSFQVSSTGQLVTNTGFTVQPGITIRANAQSVTIGTDGTVSVTLPSQALPQTVGQIQMAGFVNPAGLEPKGDNLFGETAASGTPNVSAPGVNGLGTVRQGFVETSNVNVVEELVQMIQTQRSYELNSKSIQTSDQMLAEAGSQL